MSTRRIALIQQACQPTAQQTRDHLTAAIRQAADQGAELVVLQELHNGPYFCQHQTCDNFELAEPIPGPSSEYFSALAKELHVVLVCSLF